MGLQQLWWLLALFTEGYGDTEAKQAYLTRLRATTSAGYDWEVRQNAFSMLRQAGALSPENLRDLMQRMRHLTLQEQVINLNRVLRGHFAYYGIAGNLRALQKVHRFVERYWRKMLCSRSRKGYVPWEVFHRIKERFPLQRPKLRLPYGELQALAVL